MAASDLTHRYLWGTGVDQILADEQVHCDWTPEDHITDALLWPLGDHLGSVRDVVDKYGTVRWRSASKRQLWRILSGRNVNPRLAKSCFTWRKPLTSMCQSELSVR
jgi:hypothetical protein